MNPALDDLLRDWTDYQARNARANAAYRRKVTGGERCRYCSGRYANAPRHEAICSKKPEAVA